MQLQSDVGVFRRIFCRGLQIDLIEADLFRPLAHYIGVADGSQSQMTQGKIAHLVRLVRFEHIGLQQRVFGNATQGDAVVGEDVLVVFEILSELLVLRTFQPVFEFLQRMLATELIRCTGIVMRQWQVGCLMNVSMQKEMPTSCAVIPSRPVVSVSMLTSGAAISFSSQALSWASVRMDS